MTTEKFKVGDIVSFTGPGGWTHGQWKGRIKDILEDRYRIECIRDSTGKINDPPIDLGRGNYTDENLVLEERPVMTTFEVGKKYKHINNDQVAECTGITTTGKAALRAGDSEWLIDGRTIAWKEYHEPKKYWMNVYKYVDSVSGFGAQLYDSKEEAENGPHSKYYVKTIEVEI